MKTRLEYNNGKKAGSIRVRNTIKSKFYICLVHCAFFISGISIKASENDSLYWPKLMATSVITHSSHIDGYGNNISSYVYATAMKAFRELFNATGDSAYFYYLKDGADRSLSFYNLIAGSSYHDIDPVNAGSLFLFLYSESGEEKYKAAADSILKFLDAFPVTADSGYYHKDVPRMQVDDLYMASPFLSEYGKFYNSPRETAEAVRQCVLMEKHTRDTETGLYYHVWYEKKYNNVGPGCTPYFWGRGVGWIAMSLVDVLDYLPADSSCRDTVINIFQRLAEAISNVQDELTGLWWQILDKGDTTGNFLESSASCMFVYSLAKGIRLGYIDESYKNCVEKGFEGIIEHFIEANTATTINITNLCPGQGPGWSYEAYVRTPQKNMHAVGPFILAGIETTRLDINVTPNSVPYISPNIFSLSSYPNPFNDELTITYMINEKEHVILDLYNMFGQRVARLVDETMTLGKYSNKIVTASLDAGIYICRLQVGDNKSAIRMVLVR